METEEPFPMRPERPRSVGARQGDLQNPELEGHGRAAAHSGPGRVGPDVWPPRSKVGAEERSPSAPLLGPSIVKERGDEAPRDKAGEPHSPVLLPFEGGFASCKDLFAPHSPFLTSRQGPRAAHSPLFEPSEEEGMDREGFLQSCTSQEVKPDLGGMPRDLRGMSHSPPFVSHCLQRKLSNLWGMCLEKPFRSPEIPVEPG